MIIPVLRYQQYILVLAAGPDILTNLMRKIEINPLETYQIINIAGQRRFNTTDAKNKIFNILDYILLRGDK